MDRQRWRGGAVMLFMTCRKSLNPDEMKRLSAWHTAHRAPGEQLSSGNPCGGFPNCDARVLTVADLQVVN
jgi:hypothetical protein